MTSNRPRSGLPVGEPALQRLPPWGDEAWDALMEAGRLEALDAGRDAELVAQASRESDMDRLSLAYVCAAFRDLGIFSTAGETHSLTGLLSTCNILPTYQKVLLRWLTMLEEEGLLLRQADTYISKEPLPRELPSIELTDREKRYYYFSVGLADLLTGKRHPLEFFIPDGQINGVESDCVEAPIFRYCNRISAAIVRAFLSSLPAGAHLNVLEVGAGTGGTTASVLPLLDPAGTTYIFTDVSRYFTELGTRKFANYHFVQFGKLDIERPPQAQGYPDHRFGLVIAAHVLHATRLIKETVQHVRSLLTPRGLLLLLEETRFRRVFNFGMGFLPGFDRFEDQGIRTLHPLLSSAQWSELLLSHGFDRLAAFTQQGSPAELLGVDVLVARAG